MAAAVSSAGFAGVTSAMAGGIALGVAGGAALGVATFLPFEALAPGALPFAAVLAAVGAERATGAACFAACGRATGATRSNSVSAGTGTLILRSSWRRAASARLVQFI